MANIKTYLNPTQKAAYLANVLSIAKPEEQMSAVEELVLQEIVTSLDANWDNIQQAKQMLSGGAYSLRRMRAPAARRDNIEDMVTMALADGDLSKGETGPIEKLTDMLSFAQADLDLVVKRAETRLRKIKADVAKAAPDVPEEIAPQQTAELESKPLPPPPPPPVAAKPPRPQPAKPKPIPLPEIPAPKSPAPHSVKPIPAQTTLADCQECRAMSEHPNEYCFGLGSGKVNIWGCRLMNMDWTPGEDWLGAGKFRDEDTFVFDRDAIARSIEKAVDRVRTCPHVRLPLIEAAFERLPKRGSIWGRWTYRECKRTDIAATKVDAVTYMHGQRLTTTKSVCGLDPEGIEGALKIIRRALSHTASSKLNTNLLREDCA